MSLVGEEDRAGFRGARLCHEEKNENGSIMAFASYY
jgi:hypothetical protein